MATIIILTNDKTIKLCFFIDHFCPYILSYIHLATIYKICITSICLHITLMSELYSYDKLNESFWNIFWYTNQENVLIWKSNDKLYAFDVCMFYLFICTYVSEPIKISLECQTNCHADRQMQGKAARKQMIALTHVTRDFVTTTYYS